MRKLILSGALLLAFGIQANAQEEKPNRIKLYKVEKKQPSTSSQKVVQKSENEMNREEKLEYYNSIITSLDKKEEHIRKSEEETKRAEESGWFVQADKTRKEMKAKIKALETTK